MIPKLPTYRSLKHTLSFEQYLTHDDRRAREVITRLRGGTNELRIETGRYPNTNRDKPLQIHERTCLLCMSGDVEDEKHFILDCVVYVDLRKKLFVAVENLMLKKKQRRLKRWWRLRLGDNACSSDSWEKWKERSGVWLRSTYALRRLSIADERCDAAMALLRSLIRGLDWATYCCLFDWKVERWRGVDAPRRQWHPPELDVEFN